MANENEQVKNESAENSEAPAQHPLIENIVEKIEDAIENMDTDFPLSGGEEHPVHHKHPHTNEVSQTNEEHKKTSFSDDLDTEFPLSGGEVER